MVETTEATISYDLKDILSEIRTDQKAGFSELRTLIGGKADKSDLDGMRADLIAHRADDATRLGKIETELRDRQVSGEAIKKTLTDKEAQRALRWKVFYAALTVLVLTAGILVGLLR